MFERIRVLAQNLQMRDGQLVELARLIAQDGSLLDLEYMRYADAMELETTLLRRLSEVVCFTEV
jgi:hypothetical protein